MNILIFSTLTVNLLIMRITIIAFSNIYHDSRVRRQIRELREYNDLTVICLYSIYENILRHLYPDVHFYFLKWGSITHKKSLKQYIEREWILKWTALGILRRIRSDSVIANDLEALVPAYFNSIHRAKNIIYDSHEIWTEREGCRKSLLHKLINNIELALERHIVQRIKKICTVSEPITVFLKDIWHYKRHIHTIWNLPLDNIPIQVSRKEFNIPGNNTVFVYTGAISSRRNIDKLIDVFPDSTGLTLLLIGEIEFDLKAAIEKRTNIIHIAKVPPEHLISYLSIADIGIHPLNTDISINHKYALPNKFFQYMEAGLALCMFDSISVKALPEGTDCGISISMNSIDDIKVAIDTIIKEDISAMKHNSQNTYSSFAERNNTYRSIVNNP